MKHIKALIVGVIVVIAAQALSAQDAGWTFTLSGGIAGENVYLGSDDYYLTPLPNFRASYAKGKFNGSFSLLDGLGLSYRIPSLGLLASLSVKSGGTRNAKEYTLIGFPVKHSAKTQKLLEGTPNLDTPLEGNIMLAYLSPVGLFGASLAYHPTKVEYNQANLKNETRQGYVYSLQYMIELPAAKRLTVSGLANVDFMDRNYADTWYSVDRETNSLNTFKANAGLHSSTVAVEIKYQLSKRINFSFLGASTILLEDARNSPFTIEPVQRTMMLQTLYHF